MPAGALRKKPSRPSRKIVEANLPPVTPRQHEAIIRERNLREEIIQLKDQLNNSEQNATSYLHQLKLKTKELQTSESISGKNQKSIEALLANEKKLLGRNQMLKTFCMITALMTTSLSYIAYAKSMDMREKEERIALLSQQIDTKESELKLVSDSNSTLLTKMKINNRAFEGNRAELAAVQSKLTQEIKKNIALKAEASTNARENVKFQQSLNSLKASLSASSNQMNALKSKISALEATNQNLSIDKSELLDELSNIRVSNEVQTGKLTKSQNLVKELSTKNANLSLQLAEVDDTLSSLKHEQTILKQDISDANSTIKSKNARIAEQDEMISELKQKIEALKLEKAEKMEESPAFPSE